MSEISNRGRSHDELHRDYPEEYNRIIDLDHDIDLVDEHYEYKISGTEKDTKETFRQRSRDLRDNYLSSKDLEGFNKEYKKLEDDVRYALRNPPR